MTYLPTIFGLFLCLFIFPFSLALKFDLQAHTGHTTRYERCIRNFVAKDTLVVVTAIVGGSKGDGQLVNMHVCCYLRRVLRRQAAVNKGVRKDGWTRNMLIIARCVLR